MAYQDTLVALADDTERGVVAAYRAFLDGTLEREEAVNLIAALIARGNGRARSLADLAMATQIMVELGAVVPAPGVEYPDDMPRLVKAAETVLTVAEASTVPEAIIVRLARSEPIEAAASAATDSMIRSGYTRGWTRQRSPACCQLCTWWWRDGRVWPKEHPFQTHKGCTCTPKPVLAKDIKLTHKVARMEGIR